MKRSSKKTLRRGRKAKEGRPQEILSAAFEEFAAHGYAAARLEDVARRCGIAKGTIYLYFKDKQGLFRAVVRSMIRPVFDQLIPFVEKFSGSAEELLCELQARHYAHVVRNERARAILRLLIAEGGQFPQLSEIFYREIIEPGVSALRQVLEKGEASGEFRKTTTKDFPQILVAPGLLAVMWILILGERYRFDLDSYMSAHRDFVLRSLRREESGSPPVSRVKRVASSESARPPHPVRLG